MGRINPSLYWPTDPHLWLAGKIPTRPWENCRETSERKSRPQSSLGTRCAHVAGDTSVQPL